MDQCVHERDTRLTLKDTGRERKERNNANAVCRHIVSFMEPVCWDMRKQTCERLLLPGVPAATCFSQYEALAELRVYKRERGGGGRGENE